MKASKSIFRYIGIIVCCIMLSLVSVLCCYGGIIIRAMTPVKTAIEEIRLDNNQTIRIWYETDIQHPSPSIYYEITQASEVIVPAKMIVVDSMYRPSYEYEIQVAFAQDKTLVCVYDSEYWDNGLLILYNTQTQ